MDPRFTELHCIMPIANLGSVMTRGILSYERAAKLPHHSVALQPVQDRRDQKQVPGGLKLHQYANLYFHARNPMMFKRQSEAPNLCVLRVSVEVLGLDGTVISDQNAASDYVRFLHPRQWRLLDIEAIYAIDWRHPDNRAAYYRHRSQKCAEVLVPQCVEAQYISGAYVLDDAGKRRVDALGVSTAGRDQSHAILSLGNHRSMFRALIRDLFESRAQTLVNTVNCVGVMGKGVAEQFKKRFPAMFQDYKSRTDRNDVRLGEPYLFHDASGRQIVNFPTKGHWRSPSRVADIERGLDYLAEHIQEWGVSSLALPPLGCGNGGLEWSEVGPLIWRKLHRLPIDVDVYAPYGTPQGGIDRRVLVGSITNEPGRQGTQAQAPQARVGRADGSAA